MTKWRETGWFFALLASQIGLSACSVDVHDGIGPRAPIPNVEGFVVREITPAADLEVDLRIAADATVVATAETDDDGKFEFSDVSAGEWEIKVSGQENGDFDSVSREFHLGDQDDLLSLPVFDIFAYGAASVEPADSALLTKPDPFNAITFRWILPRGTLHWARVQLYDEGGNSVWYSESEVVGQVLWNGLGNRGTYNGELVAEGTYTWRVKMEFLDSLQGRTDVRRLVLQ